MFSVWFIGDDGYSELIATDFATREAAERAASSRNHNAVEYGFGGLGLYYVLPAKKKEESKHV